MPMGSLQLPRAQPSLRIHMGKRIPVENWLLPGHQHGGKHFGLHTGTPSHPAPNSRASSPFLRGCLRLKV